MTVKDVRSKKEERSLVVVSEEHQVYTLGAQEKAWRMINCEHPHRPHLPPYHTANELCINGIVFYYGWIRKEASLISFDVRSEGFDVIKLPLPEDERHLQEISCLGNYGGKIALMSRVYSLTLDMHVLKNASKQEWSKVSILVPCRRDLSEQYMFKFKGALSTGELIFASYSVTGQFCLFSYDPKEDTAKQILI
ncbi:unnamed protein product [Microthlaspi erraticum]|uniref:F-box associated beta-propeller type 3 domain-containing protein n=1 Tax=Microthlaspi erraticum TaxID=1685480 RepID=A0A6D2JMZ3_9BRAS|nr:unnamed protein product [Microthlaspi erraticum]